ncbi:MAG TPA: hypothetical protein VI122_11080 [Thermoleophilaceae bacterium]
MAENKKGSRGDQDRDWEVERYRRAAEDALQQLDWCIGYLHGIRKLQVSKALAKNRSYIRNNLLEREEQPLPAQQTKQT